MHQQSDEEVNESENVELSTENSVLTNGTKSFEFLAPQNEVEESCIIKRKSAQMIFQRAINILKAKFYDFHIPKNESDWQELFENTLLQSKNRSLRYDAHLYSWLQLINTAEEFKKPEFAKTFLTCFDHAIVTLPIKMFESDTTWTVFVDLLYSKILDGKVEQEDALPVLKKVENKFIFSPKHAKTYWNVIMRNEKQLMKKQCISLEEERTRTVEMYQKRFSNPYLNMEGDYNNFMRWSVDVDLDQELRIQVQETFLKNVEYTIPLSENMLGRKTSMNNVHHLQFEEYVEQICAQDSPNLNKLEAICEEVIAHDHKSICYYWVYLHALAHPKFEGIKRSEKIYDVIKRCYRIGKFSCDGMEQRFLEDSVVIASHTLCSTRVSEVIEDALTLFPIERNMRKWHARSRGIIIAISNMIHAKTIEPSNFEKYFLKIIAPCNWDFYKCSVVPPELIEKTRYETKYLDLIDLWIMTYKSYHELSWTETIALWTNIFADNSHPVMLAGYCDFVRNHGNPQEALTASKFAIDQMSNYELTEQTSRCTRRCFIKIILNHISVASTTGDTATQLETSRMLQKKLTAYAALSQNKDESRDLYETGVFPYDSFYVTSDSEKLSQESASTIKSTESNHSSDNSLANRLKSLRVEQDTDTAESVVASGAEPKTGKQLLDDDTAFRVFIHNLSYKATEADIEKAFRDRGFHPTVIQIKRNINNKSTGQAFAQFETSDSSKLAVKHCDRFEICERTTYVTFFKPRPKKFTKPLPSKPLPIPTKPLPSKPTMLNITNLPVEWRNKDKILNALMPYGHIKNVTIDEGENLLFNVKVEFHMEGDAENAYNQIINKKVFQDIDVTCRLGYVSKKRQKGEKVSPENKKNPPKRIKEIAEVNIPETSEEGLKKSNAPIAQGPLMKNPDKVKKSTTKEFRFIPTQCVEKDGSRSLKRFHLKKARLEIPHAAPSLSSSTSPEEVPAKRVKSKKSPDQDNHYLPSHESGTSQNSKEADVSASTSSSTQIEEEPVVNETHMMTNKDFQKLLNKKPN